MPFHCKPPQTTTQNTANSSRRQFLKLGLATSAALFAPISFAKVTSSSIIETSLTQAERKLSFQNLHTGEQLNATYWAEGQYQSNEINAINHILRDHRTGDTHAIDNELLNMLNVLHEKMDSNKAFQIISGYRSPKTNAALNKKSSGVAKKSLHMRGKAIDIRLPGCQLSDLRNAALNCQAGGVGYYPKSNFIHVDTGRVRHWG